MNPNVRWVFLVSLVGCFILLIYSYSLSYDRFVDIFNNVTIRVHFSMHKNYFGVENMTDVKINTTEEILVTAKSEITTKEGITTTPIRILSWQWSNPYTVRNNQLPDYCGGCHVTTDKNAFNISDVIMLTDHALVQKVIEFPERLRHQVFVFVTGENPCHTVVINKKFEANRNLTMFDDLFNMTITYRRDSDVVHPYGCWDENLLKSTKNVQTTNKSKVAIIVASDCDRVGAMFRKIYTTKLIDAGLKLDRFGRCFGPRFKGDFRELLTQYKFYMAFENGIHCRDYITEKFWRNSIAYGLVPVVWGSSKADVARVAPPGSYIHVEDFNSPKEVAEYLDYLDKNDTAYQEYFKWRLDTPSSCGNSNPTCSLCKLVTSGHRGRPMKITDWWFGTENKECLSSNMTAMTEYFNDFFGVS